MIMKRRFKSSIPLINIFFAMLLCCHGYAQSSVIVNARAQADRILIRWAVDAPVDWQKANKEGFVLYKMLIKKDGKLLDNPEKKQVAVLKPLPLTQWMDVIQSDNYAAIIAQSIYGESFGVEQKGEGQLAQIINTADELNQRHSFALFAADLSFQGARMAGWAYEDSLVIPGEVYAYQVVASKLNNINPGAFMIGLIDFEPLPKVNDLMALPQDSAVLLSWGIERLKRTYSAYMIERSSDKTTYIPISQTSIVDINSQVDKPSTQMFFGDKLASNDQEYYYRIYGISSFGEKGPYSEVVKTKGVPSVLIAPRVINYSILNTDEVNLEWEFPQAEEKNISGFEIHLADKDSGPYKIVAKGIDKTKRRLTYKGLFPSNYFKVAVVDQKGQKLLSQSALVQPSDSVPPAVPQDLKGYVDSLGYVYLNWKPNKEKDLAGYRVLKANAENEEFVDIFNKVISANEIKDSVSFAISNRKVYYRILAEDLRYNRSVFSEVLVLEKPDKIPPTAPVFKDFETKDGKNKLVWINSSSTDVAQHILRRKLKGANEWSTISTFNMQETEFLDEKTEADQTYEYLIQAQDKTGLLSAEDGSKVGITTINNTPVVVMKNIESVIDRSQKTATLYWRFDSKHKVTELQIYKNKKGEKPTLWKVLDGKFQSVADKGLSMNTEYEYYFLPALMGSKAAKGEKLVLKY